MSQAPFMWIDGWITAVQGGPRAIADEITYDARGLGSDGIVEVLAETPYNRAAKFVEILAAEINDMVRFQVNRTTGETRLYVWTERDATYDCDGKPVEV